MQSAENVDVDNVKELNPSLENGPDESLKEDLQTLNTMGDSLPEVKLSVMVQNIKDYLIVQPRPDATAVAKASLFPLLYSLEQDVWSPSCLRQVEAHDKYLRYHLDLNGDKVSIDVWGVGQDLKRPPVRKILPEGGPWGVRTNGSDWQLIIFNDSALEEDVFDFSLYGDVFREVIFQLFSPRQDSLERRVMLGKSLLLEDILRKQLYRLVNTFGMEKITSKNLEGILQMFQEAGLLNDKEQEIFRTESMQKALENYIEAINQGYIRIMKPLSDITVEDVKYHCKVIQNLKGGLKAYFDDTLLEVSSRSGFYYILSAIAVQFGRSDVIPPEDLIRPPEELPEEERSRPLGRQGWYLAFNNPDGVEDYIVNLLNKLNLNHRFKATYNNIPFPNKA